MENLEELTKRLKKESSFLQKLSYRCMKEMLKRCSIITISNRNLYKENETNLNSYLILYGRAFLTTVRLGIYTECSAGDFLAEEAVLESNFTR